jgi:D-3-phosphoglycerate dehydrogenase
VARGRVLVIDPTWELAWAEAELHAADVSIEAADRPEGDDVIGLLVCPEIAVGRPELERLPRLEAVATNSTGFDHLDVAALADAGVWCSHIAGYCTEEVAEHVIAMTLALLRGIVDLDRDVRAGRWYDATTLPRRVEGACLGIVGFGRIGRAVAWRARALGLEVVAADAVVGADDMRAEGVEPVALDALLERADVVTLHAPLDGTTQGMLDADAFRRMKPGSFLVNCARARLADHEALGEALRSGKLAGAALDVFPSEPPTADEPALHWPRTIVNPHASWYSPEAFELCYSLPARDLALALTGGEPVYALARPRR